MKKTKLKRQAVIDKIADHLLENGLQQTSLRQLAKVVGMSDRMLMYYFTDKDDLVTAALNAIALRMVTLLENAGSEQLPYQALLPQLVHMIQTPTIRPYLRLWLELVSPAAGEIEPYASISQQIFHGFLNWIASTLKVEREEERQPLAALALATIEGLVLLDALNYNEQIADALKGISLQTT